MTQQMNNFDPNMQNVQQNSYYQGGYHPGYVPQPGMQPAMYTPPPQYSNYPPQQYYPPYGYPQQVVYTTTPPNYNQNPLNSSNSSWSQPKKM
jgi:hypothetical protein